MMLMETRKSASGALLRETPVSPVGKSDRNAAELSTDIAQCLRLDQGQELSNVAVPLEQLLHVQSLHVQSSAGAIRRDPVELGDVPVSVDRGVDNCEKPSRSPKKAIEHTV
jgi:hypothetical protein